MHSTNSQKKQSLLVVWWLSSIVNSACTFFWDVLMDWGLGQVRSGRHLFLRGHLVYPVIWYYVAIGADFVLRCTWSLQLASAVHLKGQELTLVLEVAEVFRRAMWNLFRVEWYHVENKLYSLPERSV
ncbi:solute carrier family 53 member 1-like isoform X2 [Zophobas morio]